MTRDNWRQSSDEEPAGKRSSRLVGRPFLARCSGQIARFSASTVTVPQNKEKEFTADCTDSTDLRGFFSLICVRIREILENPR